MLKAPISGLNTGGVCEGHLTMKNMKKCVLGFGLLLVAAASASATTITFSGSGADLGTGTLTGSSIGSFSFDIDTSTSVSPAYPGLTPAPLQDVALVYAGGSSTTLTLVETMNSIYNGISAGTTLLTINLSSAITYNGFGGLNILESSTTNSAATATFFSDLGLDGTAVANNLQFNGAVINGSVNNTTHVFTADSTQLSITTPEPMSFLLFGSGLAFAVFLRRKKFHPSKS